MKNILSIALCALVMSVVIFTGCSAQDQVAAVKTREPQATPTPTATPESTPVPTPEPANVVLMDVPEDQAAAFPVPTAYMAIDPVTEFAIPANLGYTIYMFMDMTGAVQCRAFGQKLNPADQSFAGEQGWYALTITDEPLTAETITTLAAGERVLIYTADGIEADSYIIGDTAKPFDESILKDYTAIRKVIAFDATVAAPVDLTAEAATYGPVPQARPQEEESARDSGKSGSTKTEPAPKAEMPSGGGSSSNEEENLEDRLRDSFEVEWDGKTLGDHAGLGEDGNPK